jgi:hypothetical protein
VKDHLIPDITKKDPTKEIFDALITLYESENVNQKMLLKNKFTSTGMSDTNMVANYLMRISELRD